MAILNIGPPCLAARRVAASKLSARGVGPGAVDRPWTSTAERRSSRANSWISP